MNLRTEDTDTDLAKLLQKSDKKAFKTLFERYGNRLYFFAFKYLKEKEDARDLLNEVFLKLWENRENLKTDSSLQAYLFTIAYNNIRQRFLKKTREEKYIRVFAEEYLIETSKKEEQLDYQLFVAKLKKIVDQLPARRQEIFILSYKEGLKNYEIAEKLELSDNHVKKQLVIARKFVIDRIKEDDGIAGLLFLYLFVGGSPD